MLLRLALVVVLLTSACGSDAGMSPHEFSGGSGGSVLERDAGLPRVVRGNPGSIDASAHNADSADGAGGTGGVSGAGGVAVGGTGGIGGVGGTGGSGPVCMPTTEVCNGKDDDCDGVVDNGLSCRPLGAACTSAAQCTSGFCVGDPGRCCDTACAGVRHACADCSTGYCENVRDDQWCVNRPAFFCEGNVFVDYVCRAGACVQRREDCSRPYCVTNNTLYIYRWCTLEVGCATARYPTSSSVENAPSLVCMPPTPMCVDGQCR